MKVIITRNTAVNGKSYAANLKKEVSISDADGLALIAAGKATAVGKMPKQKTLRNSLGKS